MASPSAAARPIESRSVVDLVTAGFAAASCPERWPRGSGQPSGRAASPGKRAAIGRAAVHWSCRRDPGRLGCVRSDDEREALQAWDELAPAARRSLELAHTALSTGGLAVGSALAEAGGHVVAAGRNRAYDPGGGKESLQGTPLAHAEMNVLASVAGCSSGGSQRATRLASASALSEMDS